jgi:chemotaxis protein CheY-P-specific phosphatase CheC
MSEYLRPEYTPLFREVQDTIAGYLNSDPQISAKQIEFIPEAHLDIDFQVKKALGQQGIVGVVNTLKGEFAGHNGSTNAW